MWAAMIFEESFPVCGQGACHVALTVVTNKPRTR
jgi:hypothetical protein